MSFVLHNITVHSQGVLESHFCFRRGVKFILHLADNLMFFDPVIYSSPDDFDLNCSIRYSKFNLIIPNPKGIRIWELEFSLCSIDRCFSCQTYIRMFGFSFFLVQ